MLTLIGLSYSPWSIKARWALDHHGVEYKWVEYTPMLGEPLLRLRAGLGRVSVPLLIDGRERHRDSFEIARRAETLGHGPTLFPGARIDAISRWNQTAEDLAAAGRALVTPRVHATPAALLESVPPPLRRVGRPLGRMGAAFLTRKYRLDRIPAATARETIGLALEAVREARADGRPYLLGSEFTYADVTTAVSMQFVEPPAERYCSLGPASRGCWTTPDLAKDYADVLAWRDDVYRRHWP